MTQRHPQLLITLSLQGGLVLELPGSMGTRRQVQVRDGELASTCHRILAAQLLEQTEIGLDGAPTQAQVRHWERHEIWPSGTCPFCVAEGRATGTKKSSRPLAEFRGNGTVEVRTIPVAKAKRRLETRKSIEDLGL